MKQLKWFALLAAFVSANPLVQRIFTESVQKAAAKRRSALPPSFVGERVDCPESGVIEVNGEEYDCNNVDFLSFLSAEDLRIPGSQGNLQSSDVWGWVDTENDREITILTLDTGVVFIDSTDGTNPCILSKHHSARPPSSWGDVKVIGDYAYAIKDRPDNNREVETHPGTGMEVYDLKKLSALNCNAPGFQIPERNADFVVGIHGSCHNVISNTESQRIYTCGCRGFCDGGLAIFDVKADPLHPNFLGCVDADGYTHDAQCVIYDGPDDKFAGREICLAFNEDTFTIWDTTDPIDPLMISRTPYPNQAYTHQGWFNYDMTRVLLDDELDEICNRDDIAPGVREDCEFLVQGELNGELKTTTYVWDVTSLEAPEILTPFIHRDQSIDHNLYVWGAIHEKGWGGNKPLERIPDPNLAYLNNYMAGLIILDISGNDGGEYVEVGSFDITAETESEFQGAWSGYLHPSGVYAMSSIEKGIFFLDPRVNFVDANPISTPFPTTSTEVPAPLSDDSSASPVLYVFFFLFVMATGVVGWLLVKNTGKKEEPAESTGSPAHYVSNSKEV